MRQIAQTPAPKSQEAQAGFWACDLRDGRTLPPGVLNHGRNLRYPDGLPETRRGVLKPGWANRVAAGAEFVAPHGEPYGVGVFRNPNGLYDWTILACSGGCFRTRPYNQTLSVPLPPGVKLLSNCRFVQAFNKLWCFRGRYLAPLRLTDLEAGFEDLLPHFDAAESYDVGEEIAYGPYQTVCAPITLGAGELTSASTTATVAHTNHGFDDGATVVITGAAQAEYNGAYVITVVDADSFTYQFAGSATTPATGTIKVMRAGIVRSGDTATVVTESDHGYVTGADVTIRGATQAEYNGRFNITVLDPRTFTFSVFGLPASPATTSSSIEVSNMAHYYEALGTLLTLTNLTSSGTTATATKNDHGFSNGDVVTIAGATPSAYNGTFTISNVTTNTFDYTLASDPADTTTGTITARLDRTLAGETPESHASAWQRVYDILPNADTALFTNNRLLVPTAYTPGTTDYTDATGNYTKVDFIVATDIQDELHIDFSNEFRINQGSSDEIVDLAVFSEEEGVVVVWKGSSWGVLTGVAMNLGNISLTMRSMEYGLSARSAWARCGQDIVFVSNRRGFVSIRHSESGKLVSVDVPLSAPIQKLIDRIDWTRGNQIRLANWNSHLYAFVPMNLPPTILAENLGAGLEWTAPGDDLSTLLISGLTPGNQYQVTWGDAKGLGTITRPGGPDTPERIVQQYYPADGLYELRGQVAPDPFIYTATNDHIVLLAPQFTSGPVQAIVRSQHPNYAVLVFSFVSAKQLGQPEQGWCPWDVGSALNVFEWFKTSLDGQERLFFLSRDGWVNLWEGSDRGDQVQTGIGTGLAWEEIETRARFKPQGQALERLHSPTGAHIALETLRPCYSLTVHFEGVNKKTTLCTEKQRSPVNYFRPWNAEPWDATNVNDDHATPYREDYTVVVESSGVNLGTNGLVLDRFQEVQHHFRMNGRQGRSASVELVNIQGRVRLHGLLQDAKPGRKRFGVQT